MKFCFFDNHDWMLDQRFFWEISYWTKMFACAFKELDIFRGRCFQAMFFASKTTAPDFAGGPHFRIIGESNESRILA
jgi:hypothetical protein